MLRARGESELNSGVLTLSSNSRGPGRRTWCLSSRLLFKETLEGDFGKYSILQVLF